ncbi:MAG: Holliday junction resolvase RuvX [Candidatus Marinimicrobia bacterium]|nr:Holliday junction resolvase RuvX [Candidatus Neomarinimicrobiota bacterium]
MPRILGIDYGEKRVGLAVSDPQNIIAQPLITLIREDSVGWWHQLEAVIVEQEIVTIVVGYPLTMKGTKSAQTEKVDRFILDLGERMTIPIDRYDERLTSVAAQRALIQQGIKASRNKEAVDYTAAALILQDYLDSRG